MPSPRTRFPALVLLVGLASLACSPSPSGPDVVVITVDTLRADRLGCYGDSSIETPTLDALAAAGVRFEDAASVTPITLPSHASIFTGRYPVAHGVRNNGTYVLPEGETTLAELLVERGYRTGAFVGAYVLAYRFGLGQGFEQYDDRFEGPGAISTVAGSPPSERRAAAVTDAALDWVDQLDPNERLLLWAHYFDPHADYDPPAPFDERYPDPYRGEIAYTDREVGRLLDGLRERGRMDDTLVVVVADHGEAFGEHDETKHGLFIYQPTVAIPLLFSWPGRLPEGESVGGVVSQVDVLPTLLGLMEVEAPVGLHGVDLSRGMREGEGALHDREPILIENLLPRLEFGWSELWAVRDGPLKTIEAPRSELYRLDRDPAEADDLSGDEATTLAEQAALLARRRESVEADALAPAEGTGGLDDEIVERLRSLGYTAGSGAGGGGRDGETLPDPKDRVEEYDRSKRAHALVSNRRYRDAAQVIDEILASNPGNLRARHLLGEARVGAGDAAGARDAYLEVLSLDPVDCVAMLRLGEIAVESGAGIAEADDWYAKSLDCNAGQPELWARRAGIALERGRPDDASKALARALQLDPANPDYVRQVVRLHEERGDTAAARQAWEMLLEVAPDVAEAWVAIGLIDARDGELRRAQAAFERAVSLDDRNALARANLGTLLVRRGKVEEGAARMQEALDRDGSLADVRFNLALALIRLGRLDDAERHLARHARRRPDDRRGWEKLAEAREAAGDADGARRARSAAGR
jgi:arylsulfatase A-like enzyme/predicted Zn-dependent protease